MLRAINFNPETHQPPQTVVVYETVQGVCVREALSSDPEVIANFINTEIGRWMSVTIVGVYHLDKSVKPAGKTEEPAEPKRRRGRPPKPAGESEADPQASQQVDSEPQPQPQPQPQVEDESGIPDIV